MKVKGLQKGKVLCELSLGDAFAHGGIVYIRTYLYVMQGKDAVKCNAFHLDHGRAVYLDWKTEVIPLELKAKVPE